jgi:hypothetical protein
MGCRVSTSIRQIHAKTIFTVKYAMNASANRIAQALLHRNPDDGVVGAGFKEGDVDAGLDVDRDVVLVEVVVEVDVVDVVDEKTILGQPQW